MRDTLRVATGIFGNASSLLFYAAPILTFRRVVRRRSTEKFSCIPYIIALLNCLLYTWYGLPVVSCGWENLLVVTINGLGVLLEASFVSIYIWFALAEQKRLASLLVMPVVMLFSMSALVSSFGWHDHQHRKAFVGSIGLVASISMYSSPLVAMKQVIRTKSVEFMPFYLSFFSFAASSLWLAYGLLGHDIFLAAPNILGSPIGVLQLVLYCVYSGNKRPTEESLEADLEKMERDFHSSRPGSL